MKWYEQWILWMVFVVTLGDLIAKAVNIAW